MWEYWEFSVGIFNFKNQCGMAISRRRDESCVGKKRSAEKPRGGCLHTIEIQRWGWGRKNKKSRINWKFNILILRLTSLNKSFCLPSLIHPPPPHSLPRLSLNSQEISEKKREDNGKFRNITSTRSRIQEAATQQQDSIFLLCRPTRAKESRLYWRHTIIQQKALTRAREGKVNSIIEFVFVDHYISNVYISGGRLNHIQYFYCCECAKAMAEDCVCGGVRHNDDLWYEGRQFR